MKITIEIDCPRWMRAVAKVAAPVVGILVVGVAVGAPTQFKAGDPLSAAAMNKRFSDLENRPAFRAYRAAPLTVPDEAFFPVKFDQEILDDDDSYDPGTGKYTVKTAGTYLVKCGVSFAASGVAAHAVSIYKNGVEIDSVTTWSAGSTVNTTVNPAVVQIERTVEGDELECRAYQHTGASLGLNTFQARNSFSVIRID